MKFILKTFMYLLAVGAAYFITFLGVTEFVAVLSNGIILYLTITIFGFCALVLCLRFAFFIDERFIAKTTI